MAHNVSWEGHDITVHYPMYCHVLQVHVEASCGASIPMCALTSLNIGIILLFSHIECGKYPNVKNIRKYFMEYCQSHKTLL